MKSPPYPQSLAVPFKSSNSRTSKGASQRWKKLEINEMRKRTLCRVDVLEQEERARQLEHQSSLATISFFCWQIALAYYVGGLKPTGDDPGEGLARALHYESRHDYLEALLKGKRSETNRRFKNAARCFFAQVNLDFDRSPQIVLFEAFFRRLSGLPQPWLNWLESKLREECRTAPIGHSYKLVFEFLGLQ